MKSPLATSSHSQHTACGTCEEPTFSLDTHLSHFRQIIHRHGVAKTIETLYPYSRVYNIVIPVPVTRGLRYCSVTALLLELWVRIPPREWTFVFVSVVCGQVADSA